MRIQAGFGVQPVLRPSVRPPTRSFVHSFIRSLHVPHRTDFDSQMDTQVPRT